MTVYAVFDSAGLVTPLWATRELAEAEAERRAAETGLRYTVHEIEVVEE